MPFEKIERNVHEKLIFFINDLTFSNSSHGTCTCYSLYVYRFITWFNYQCWDSSHVTFLFVHQWLLAFFAYCFPGAEMSRRATLLPWHTFFGMVIFLLAVATALTGLSGFCHELSTRGFISNFTGLLIDPFICNHCYPHCYPSSRLLS